MDKVQEAIKILEYNLENSDDSIFEDVPEAIKTQYLALQLTIAQALKLLESEPEPGELSKKLMRCADFTQCPDAGIMLKEAAEEIDRLEASFKGCEKCKEQYEAELKAKDEEIEKYKIIEQILNKAIPEFLAENFILKP